MQAENEDEDEDEEADNVLLCRQRLAVVASLRRAGPGPGVHQYKAGPL